MEGGQIMNQSIYHVQVWCQGQRSRTEYNWQVIPCNHEDHAYLGVSSQTLLCVNPTDPSYTPTDKYEINTEVVTPANLIWGIEVFFKDILNSTYHFELRINTKSVPVVIDELVASGIKRIHARSELQKRYGAWLHDKWPWGVIGKIQGAIRAEYKKTQYYYVSNCSPLQSVTIDHTNKDWQFLGDYSYLAQNMIYTTYRLEITEEPDPSVKFKIVNGRLYGQYTDSVPPYISELQPTTGEVIVENFKPAIAGQFDDRGGSGINTKTFSLVIDSQDYLNRIEVAAGNPDLEQLDPQGFRYEIKKDLLPGPHTVEVSIEDNQGLSSTKAWGFLVKMGNPQISNHQPEHNEQIKGQPIIAAEFFDQGAGIDTDSFKLYVDDAKTPVTKRSEGLNLTSKGFSYHPPVELKPGEHSIRIEIADLYGNPATCEFRFGITLIPVNHAIGELPLAALEGLGSVTASHYVSHSGGAISKIKDLVNRDPRELADTLGIPLDQTIDNVRRARIACSQVRFNRMKFEELNDLTIWQLAHMSDLEIRNYFIEVDDEGIPVPEPQADIDALRENIELLFVCLDNSVLQDNHTMTFGKVVQGLPSE